MNTTVNNNLDKLDNFGYFTYEESNKFAYYSIPKELFTNSNYKHISTEAKLLYGLLRDRNSLSIKNNWVDENNNIFIFFTRLEVQEILGIKKDTAIKIFKELKEVNLIKEKRQGLGKANKIYVGKIMVEKKHDLNPKQEQKKDITLQTTAVEQKSEKPTSENLFDRNAEVDFSDTNNTDINKPKKNNKINQSIKLDNQQTIADYTSKVKTETMDAINNIYKQANIELYYDNNLIESLKIAIKELYNDMQFRDIIQRLQVSHIDSALYSMRIELEKQKIQNPMNYFKKVLVNCIVSSPFENNIFTE